MRVATPRQRAIQTWHSGCPGTRPEVAMKIPENLEGPVVAFSVGFAVLAVAMMIKLVGLLR